MIYFEVECRYLKDNKVYKEYFYTSSKFYYHKLNQFQELHRKNNHEVLSFWTKQVLDEEVIEFIENSEFSIFEPQYLDSRVLIKKDAG